MTEAIQHIAGHVNYLVCVDGSAHSRVAVRFACLRAKNAEGNVTLLTAIEPAEFQHWMAVEDVMLEERREDAERLLNDLAAEVNEWAGVMPSLTVRDGHIGEEILAAVAEDPTINFLVVGAAPPPHKHGKLISWLAGHTAESLNIPLVIVPGNLTDEQLINIT
ncbi:MAG: universal stress protein [Alphaproteobacteria bacterium]|jgi:nucleotide-binding universal stress UspA family protein